MQIVPIVPCFSSPRCIMMCANLKQKRLMKLVAFAFLIMMGRERLEEVISPPRLLDGQELMKELNLRPGPFVGQLLEAIRENQAAGKIENREQALAFAREELAKIA